MPKTRGRKRLCHTGDDFLFRKIFDCSEKLEVDTILWYIWEWCKVDIRFDGEVDTVEKRNIAADDEAKSMHTHLVVLLVLLWIVRVVRDWCRCDGTSWRSVISFHIISSHEVFSFGCDGWCHVAIDHIAAVWLLWSSRERWDLSRLRHCHLHWWCWWTWM